MVQCPRRLPHACGWPPGCRVTPARTGAPRHGADRCGRCRGRAGVVRACCPRPTAWHRWPGMVNSPSRATHRMWSWRVWQHSPSHDRPPAVHPRLLARRSRRRWMRSIWSVPRCCFRGPWRRRRRQAPLWGFAATAPIARVSSTLIWSWHHWARRVEGVAPCHHRRAAHRRSRAAHRWYQATRHQCRVARRRRPRSRWRRWHRPLEG